MGRHDETDERLLAATRRDPAAFGPGLRAPCAGGAGLPARTHALDRAGARPDRRGVRGGAAVRPIATSRGGAGAGVAARDREPQAGRLRPPRPHQARPAEAPEAALGTSELGIDEDELAIVEQRPSAQAEGASWRCASSATCRPSSARRCSRGSSTRSRLRRAGRALRDEGGAERARAGSNAGCAASACGWRPYNEERTRVSERHDRRRPAYLAAARAATDPGLRARRPPDEAAQVQRRRRIHARQRLAGGALTLLLIVAAIVDNQLFEGDRRPRQPTASR